MRKFEGNINGKIYTDESEFDKALFSIDDEGDMYVSYRYVSTPDTNDNSKLDNKNYISEEQYVKNITNKEDVGLDADLIIKLKEASNKSDIKDVVNRKIEEFDSRISSNLLSINNLKSDCAELEEKIKDINNQIQTLDNANNNYYLNKKYYTHIKQLIEAPTDIPEVKEQCCCGCGDEKCSCGSENTKKEKNDINRIKEHFNRAINNSNKKDVLMDLSEVVDYFLKNF